jgi:hypothetical protein
MTLPPGSKGIFMSGQTSLLAVLVHAVVFYLVSRMVTHCMKTKVYVAQGFAAPVACKAATDCSGGKLCVGGKCQ